MSELEELKNKIRLSRYTYVIKDPYPEHSFYESLNCWQKKFAQKPEDISIHKAYRQGMEFMWSLIEPLVK